MKYGLKQRMIHTPLEIVVCKWSHGHYEMYLTETAPYSMDDPYFYDLGKQYKTKKSTQDMTDKLFAYLNQKGFENVKRKFIDVS